MNNITESFTIQQKLLIDLFEHLINDGFLPCSSGKNMYDESTVKLFKENLAKQKFFVSVCGQIKAGKSSFLNYLLFQGKQVLPSALSPCTAKITQISYGEKEYAIVHFYDKNEWTALKNMVVVDEKGNSINYYEVYLQSSITTSAEKGIHDIEFITAQGRTEILNDFNTLDNYISAEGALTPFVSMVELFIPNPSIKNVIIVDTPGINDNNELRSQVTTKFINQSSAVLYMFPSTSPLHRADYDFIDQYLAGIPSSRIVYSASRCDLVKNPRDIAAHIEFNMENDVEFMERHLFKGHKVYPFSALAALIKLKIDNGISLTDDESFFKNKISLNLIESQGFISELIDAIGKNIMNEKGNAVLSDASSKILSIANSKLESEKAVVLQKEQQMNDLSLSIDEITIKIQQIKAVEENVNELLGSFERRRKNVLQDIDSKLYDLQNEVRNKGIQRYDAWINSVRANKAIKLSTYELRNILYEEFRYAEIVISDAEPFRKLELYQKDIKEKLEDETKELFRRKEGYLLTPIVPVAILLQQVLKEIHNISTRFEEARVTRFIFFTNEIETKERLLQLASGLFEKVSTDFCEKLKNQVHEEVSTFSSLLISEITNYLETFAAGLTELQSNFDNKSQLSEKFNEELKQLKNNLTRLENIYEEMKKQIAEKIELV